MKSAPLRWPQFLACAYALGGALLVHVRAMPKPFLLLLVATIVARVALRRVSTARAILPVRLLLLALYGAAVLFTYHKLFGREAGSGLLAAMLVLKLVEAETRRDGLVLVSIGCFLTMCAFLYDQGVVQTTMAAMALVVAVAALHALQPMPDAAPAEASRKAWWPYPTLAFGNTLKLLVVSAPFAIACFIFFPRFDQPLWGAPEDAFRARSGISDRMEPGALQSIALDDRLAFQVHFDDIVPAPPDRYYRAFTFWAYDGFAWTPSEWISRSNYAAVTPQSVRIAYDLVVEPTDQRWIPVLDAPLAAPEGARLTADFQARADHPINSTEKFHAVSAIHHADTALPATVRRAALTLPGGAAPRAVALAKSWRAAGQDDAQIIASALERYRADFSYSLEPPQPRGDPVDDFLFDSKIGFCEHFASSFTVLMRAAGIPARVVTGYQGGTFNSIGGFYLLRNSDAHAWSEVWLDGRGWVRVDPTAAVAPDRIRRGSLSQLRTSEAWYSKGGIWSGLRERFEYVGYWWNRAIIEYNALRQRDMLRDLGVENPDWQQLSTALAVSVAIALGLAGLALRVRRPRRRELLLAAYHRYCARLADAGLARRANEGPLAFGDRAAAAMPAAAAQIRMLSAGFARLRYAPDLGDGEARRSWIKRAHAFRVPKSATIRARRSSSA